MDGRRVTFGTDAETAAALAVARRLRDLIVFLPGLLFWARAERRMAEREESLDRKLQMLDEKIQAQDQRAGQISQRAKAVEAETTALQVRFAEVQHRPVEALCAALAETAERLYGPW